MKGNIHKKGNDIFDEYKVRLVLTRPLLGTNPCDPAVLDTHILDRQRKLIMEKSNVNSAVNKYLHSMQISKERGAQDVEKVMDKLEELVGTPLSPEQKELVLAGKLEELKETFAELDIKGTTVFFWDKDANLPCIGDHMIPGFLKAAAEALCRTVSKGDKKVGTMLSSIAYTCGIINTHVSVRERYIVSSQDLMRREDGTPAYLQRSLRAQTAQGPRVTLAKSEVIDAGAEFNFHVRVLKNSPMTEGILHRLFEYGEIKGLGQWRNANYGQFSYELEQLTTDVHHSVPKPKQNSNELPRTTVQ